MEFVSEEPFKYFISWKKDECFRRTEIDQRVTNKSMREIRKAFKQYRQKNETTAR